MTMIQLFHGLVDKSTVDIMAFVEDTTGDLIIEGCNSYPDAENQDDSDEEYWLRIAKDDKIKLLESLDKSANSKKGLDALLLKALAKAFNTGSSFNDVRNWCGTHSIPARFSSFT